jgi:protein SCO1/2
MRTLLRVLMLVALLMLSGACGAPATFVSHEFERPAPTPGFRLTAADGTRVGLDDFKGKVVVVYFGYTHCPDVCPTTVGTFATAFEMLPADVRQQMRFVMVTVDPRRDSPEVMDRYVHHFSPEFIGLSGSEDEIAAVVAAWRLPVECGEVGSDGSYAVSHPASALVLDRNGLQRLHVPFGTSSEDIASDLKLLLEKG